MGIFKKIKDFIFKPYIADAFDVKPARDLNINRIREDNVIPLPNTNDTFHINVGTFKENPDKTVFITNNHELLEPGDLYYENGRVYLYTNGKLEELIYRDYKFTPIVEFHYYEKEALTKRFLRNLAPGQLFALIEPSYAIYICVKDDDKIRYLLAEGEGDPEIFLENCKEE